MEIKRTTSPFLRIDRAPSRTAQALVTIGGLFFILVALALLLVPQWFFDTIGHFPPFNRHYMGDLGAFLLPLGAGLLYAARDPARYRLLIAIVAAGSVLHVLNHLYDALVVGPFSVEHLLTDALPLAIAAILLIVAWREAGKH
jgi:hypothetical protein